MNGVLDDGVLSGTVPASQFSPAENVTIGRRNGGYYFQGTIDELRIYDRALTASEIQADMNTPLGSLPADSEPPSAPGWLTASAASATQIDLSWGPATDNVGVTGYRVERCLGAGCTSFAEVASTLGPSYNDAGLVTNTTYRYRVRAEDAAGNLGPYSNAAQASTGFSISPAAAALTFTRTQQFSVSGAGGASVTWSVDGVTGGATSSGTITSAGLYTPPAATGTHTVTVTTTDLSQSASATVYISDYAGKFTHSNDNARTGLNADETVLSPANVSAATFGKLYPYPIDGIPHASPLYVANLDMGGLGVHNVVYVATEHDSVYAFDADGLSTTPLWQVSFIDPAAGVTTVPSNDTGECCDITPEIGITGTPVIDPATGTLYVVAKTKEVSGSTTTYVQRLHALDLKTGAEKLGGPVVIQATVPGTGLGSQAGQLPFDPLHENQRPALLLDNGVLYMAFASHGDIEPYHGWVLGYDATTLQQVMKFCVTPNNEGGGIWQGGGGLAADATGNLFFVTGDGTFDANTGGSDYGDSFIKLSPSGAVLDYFTPYDQATLDVGNLDLGSGGVLLLPDQPSTPPRLVTSGGKNRMLYVVNRDNMGHYNSVDNSQILQTFSLPAPFFSTPAYFDGHVYLGLIGQAAWSYQVANSLFSSAPTSQSPETYGYPGAALAVSANGLSNGILWAVQRNGASAPGVLFAYDATDLANELYNSTQAGTRDALDPAAKFSIPVIANGKVFVTSAGQLTVFGLLR